MISRFQNKGKDKKMYNLIEYNIAVKQEEKFAAILFIIVMKFHICYND